MCLLASSQQKRSKMENSDQQSEHKKKSFNKKGDMETITMLTSRKVKEEESEVVGVNNTCILMNKVVSVWTDAKMVEDIANEKGEVTNMN